MAKKQPCEYRLLGRTYETIVENKRAIYSLRNLLIIDELYIVDVLLLKQEDIIVKRGGGEILRVEKVTNSDVHIIYPW